MIALFLAACTAPPGEGTDAPTAGVLVATTTDYAVGALAVVDLQDHAVYDELAPTSGDPSVVATGEVVVQFNGFLADFIRIYDRGWREPVAEWSVGQGANPHDALWVDGLLWLTLYGRDALEIRDPFDGRLVSEVDLSPWADEDGLPEASSLLRVGDRVLVGLQRFDRGDGWRANPGVVVAVDVATRSVVESWTVGTSPRLAASPTGAPWVVTGSYVAEDGGFLPALDGDVRRLDPVAGPGEPVIVEAEQGARVDVWAERDDGTVLAAVDRGDGAYAVVCDVLGPRPAWVDKDTWTTDVAVHGGRAYLAERVLVGGGAIEVWDPGTCRRSDRLETSLPPYALAVRP